MKPVKVDLPYVNAYRDRHGKRRYYLRKRGVKPVALTGSPSSPEFIAGYQLALENSMGPTEAPGIARGTFAVLCQDYYASADFSQLAETTRRETRYALDALCREHGVKRVHTLERRHIVEMKDALKAKPGACNKMLRYLRVVLAYAVLKEYRADNPARDVKLMKLGAWRPWTAEERASFEARWPLGTLERTGYALAYYTGQRRSDLAKLTFKSIAGGTIKLQQSKTAKTLEIPIHPKLQEALTAVHPRHEAAILTGERGQRLNVVYFGHIMADAIEKAGLPKECVLHGLRKAAAVALMEAGCSVGQACAITGQSLRMMEHYSKERDQKKLGKAAMLKWRRAK